MILRTIAPLLACVAAIPLFGGASDGPVQRQAAPPSSPHASTPGGGGDAGFGKLQEGGPIGPDGREVTCDLPVSLRTKNVGGRDGAGLCVFSSIGHAARFQNEGRLWNFQSDMRKEPGGGYPEKVDAMIKKYGAGTPYVQHEGGDIEFLYQAIKTGRMPSITYDGRDMHYGPRTRIAHMINLVYMDPPDANPRWVAVLDNNFVAEGELVWLTVDDFKSRWLGNSGGWAVVLLNPPPMPVPYN